MHELLAVQAELTHLVHRTIVMANSKRGAQKPKVLRIPRPVDPLEALPFATPGEMRQFFGAPRRHRAKGVRPHG